jgi:hypothetical protein
VHAGAERDQQAPGGARVVDDAHGDLVVEVEQLQRGEATVTVDHHVRAALAARVAADLDDEQRLQQPELADRRSQLVDLAQLGARVERVGDEVVEA